MNLTHNSSRDPKLLLPELERRLHLLFDLYQQKFPNAPQPKISQTVRSVSDQTKDYAKGRTAPGAIVTHAKPGESLHNYQPGLAFDVYFEEDGKYSTNESLYKNLGLLAPIVGLEWGGVWKHPDTPHFQPQDYEWENAAANIPPVFPPLTGELAELESEEEPEESEEAEGVTL